MDEYKPDIDEEEFDANPRRKTASKGRGTPKSGKAKGHTGQKAVGKAWSGEEDWKLFQSIHPKASVSWTTIAEATGRDSKVSLPALLGNRQCFCGRL